MTIHQPAKASADLAELFARQKAHASLVRATSAEERMHKLSGLRRELSRHRTAIQRAVYEDFRKPAEESDLTELWVILAEIDYALKHLKRWMQPVAVRTPLKLLGTQSEIHYEPLGNVLIISPWNYPFNLSLAPLVSAIAAGNCIILKPSEQTPQSASLMKAILSACFPEEEVAVVEGGADEAKALLSLPFDHVFFTGSSAVGRQVMQAAAEQLTSITLELGGKSPVLVDASADVQTAAERIVFGKFANAGQTCIAPDYLLVHADRHDALVDAMRSCIETFYGTFTGGADDRLQRTSNLTHIVSDRHFDRLSGLLEDAVRKGATLISGGQADRETRFMAPTLLTNVTDAMQVMQEEIFGPLLPVLSYARLGEALAYINSKPRPLALYAFTQENGSIQAIQSGTASGGICINDTLLHFIHPELPFGGVNQSGIGKSHGRHGFLSFSNERALLHRKTPISPLKLLYPPFTRRTRALIDYVLKYL